MKIATWNVNSIRARLDHVLEWLRLEQPDLLALQETKTPDERFPVAELEAAGYHSSCNGQPAYNGVAMLSREPFSTEQRGLGDGPDEQRRVLGGRLGEWHVLNVYVPNGSEVGSEKYEYKLAWLERLTRVCAELAGEPGPLVLLGDFNIAPGDADVHDPQAWRGSVLVSEPERERLERLLALGFTDLFRRCDQEPGGYSWWDYRAAAFRRNHGLRIDLVLGNAAAASRCTACRVDRAPRGWAKPSDHAPVVAEFSD